MLAVSVVTDVFRAVLQGAPPGTVYALVALGFVLAYKTSGVFNLAFGAQAYVSAVVYFRSEEHTSELQSLMRISYAVFCLKKKKHITVETQYENNIITHTIQYRST